jgi:thioredoxin-related protein
MKYFFTFFLLAVFFQTFIYSKEINLNTLTNSAKKSNKLIFILLHKNGCGYCVRMKKNTINDPEIQTIIKKDFIFVDINVYDRDIVIFNDFMGTSKEFAIDVGYDFYPSSLFVDGDGEMVYEVAGYRKKDEFKVMLEYVINGSYGSTAF